MKWGFVCIVAAIWVFLQELLHVELDVVSEAHRGLGAVVYVMGLVEIVAFDGAYCGLLEEPHDGSDDSWAENMLVRREVLVNKIDAVRKDLADVFVDLVPDDNPDEILGVAVD